MHRLCRLFAAVTVLALLMPTPAAAWWNDGWGYRKKIALDGDTVGVPGTDGLVDVPVVIRLHSGNFSYFLDTRDDGADLRFVASDDKTPLPFHIETYDPLSGLGVIWVKVPRLGTRSQPEQIWMYYGSPEAKPAADAPATFDASQVAVFHFNEKEGLPRDATGYGNHPTESTLLGHETGALDGGVRLKGSESMRLPAAPMLSVAGAQGFTASAWILLDSGNDNGTLLSQGDTTAGFELGVRGTKLYARLTGGTAPVEVTSSQPLVAARWQHVAVSFDGAVLKLFVNGREAGSAPATRTAIAGPIVVGAAAPDTGLRGGLDELQFSSVARSSAYIAATYQAQSGDSQMFSFFDDESTEGKGIGAAYMQLLQVTLQKMSLDGWCIIGVTLLIGLIALDIIITKAVMLGRAERADREFLAFHRGDGAVDLNRRLSSSEGAGAIDPRFRKSAIHQIYIAAVEAARDIGAGTGTELSGQAIETIRASLDIRMVEEVNRLNSRLVMVTVAISGAPFLGLLGTVVGVMITFTTIAATGDVNVANIAPGIASAMGTTVVGLVVAIPCLFSYNWLASRIARTTSLMEVFGDRLITQIATLHLTAARVPNAARAAA